MRYPKSRPTIVVPRLKAGTANLKTKSHGKTCSSKLQLGTKSLDKGQLKHDYFPAIANLREKSKPRSFDMYADFTSCDGRLLVTFQASWANIDHCMGQPHRHKPAIHAMPLLFTRHEFQLLTAGNSLLHSITQRTKSPSSPFGEILGYPWVKIIWG